MNYTANAQPQIIELPDRKGKKGKTTEDWRDELRPSLKRVIAKDHDRREAERQKWEEDEFKKRFDWTAVRITQATIWREPGLTPTAKLLASVMAQHANVVNGSYRCWVSRHRLAELLGTDRHGSTLNRAVACLRDAGWIDYDPHPHHGNTRCWRLLWLEEFIERSSHLIAVERT